VDPQHGPEGGGGLAGAVAAWIGWWLASAAIWLALVDNTHVPELVVGAGVSTLAATAALVVRQQRRVVLRPRLVWLARAWRPLARYAADLPKLVRALRTRGGGRFYAVRAVDATNDPRGAAQRVLLQAAGSFTPNTYVLGTDYERGLMLVHQLVPGEDPALGADPLRLR
jgi:multisubunit Na+/H+ antiporter MnhE subunit